MDDASERWEEIINHPNYEVSTLGRIRRSTSGMGATKGRILKQTVTKTCLYPAVSLYEKDNRTVCLVHILVARTFFGLPPSPVHQINHIDGNKKNPALGNLEYVTPIGNMAHAIVHELVPKGERNGQAVLTENDVYKIRALAMDGVRQGRIAEIFGVTQSSVSMINTRKRWGWL